MKLFTLSTIEAQFKTRPYLHQLLEFERSVNLKARAFFWEMRTGKSKMVIDTMAHHALRGNLRGGLLFAPNKVHSNFTRREIPFHWWDGVPVQALAWDTEAAKGSEWQEKFERLLSHNDFAWFAVSSATMTRKDVRACVRRFINHRKQLGFIADESHDWKSPGATRSQMIRAVSRKCQLRRILTGTPVDNSPLAAYAQFQLLHEGALGFDGYEPYKEFFANYIRARTKDGRSYPKLEGYKNLDILAERIAKWTSVVLRSDCQDLPDVVTEHANFEPTDEQKRLYKELQAGFEVELCGKTLTMNELSTPFVKLKQVLSGFIKDEYGDLYHIPGPNPRLDTLQDLVLTAGGKVIIFTSFKEEARQVTERMRALGLNFLRYDGSVSGRLKDLAEDSFRSDPSIDGIVGHPRSMGQGLDFSSATAIIWYGPNFDNVLYRQARERATKIGGGNIREVLIMGPGVDPYVLENLLAKQTIAEAVSRSGLKAALDRVNIRCQEYS